MVMKKHFIAKKDILAHSVRLVTNMEMYGRKDMEYKAFIQQINVGCVQKWMLK